MTDRAAGPGPGADRLRRALLGVAAVLVLYYAVPVGDLPSGLGVAGSVVVLVTATAVLARLIVRQLQRLARGGAAAASVRIESLVALAIVVVPMFALGYLALERADPGQFASLSTKTDALYFALSTLATVGFGDVHATDQAARALVALQIAFDLVFVGALVSALARLLGEARRPDGPPHGPVGPPGEG